GEVPDEMATGTGLDRRGADVGFAVWGGVGGRRLRGSHGIPRGTGGPPPPLRGGYSFHRAGVDETAPPAASAGAKASADGLPLRRAAAVRGAGSGAAGLRLEARTLARRYERLAGVPLLRLPRPARARLRRRRPAPPGGLAAGGMATRRERTHEIFPLRPARQLHPAAAGARRQKPLEDRTGLSAAQGGTGVGSLRRPPLDRLAPSCHLGHVGACFPDLGDVAQQKKLLGGPCHRRAVRSNACCSPGPANVRIVAV